MRTERLENYTVILADKFAAYSIFSRTGYKYQVTFSRVIVSAYYDYISGKNIRRHTGVGNGISEAVIRVRLAVIHNRIMHFN